MSWRIGAPGFIASSGSKTAGRYLIVDLEQPRRCFSSVFAFSDDGGDALAHKAHHVVEHEGVVGVDEVIFVRRRAVEPARNVLPGEYGYDARNRHGLVADDAADARVRVRRPQDLEMQCTLHDYIERVVRTARYDRLAEWTFEVRPACVSGDVFFGGLNAVQGIVDALIARATA